VSGAALERLWERREHGVGGLDEDDASGPGIEAAVVALQRPSRELGDLPGELDTGRTRSHHDEGQPRLPLGGVGFQLRHLERPEDSTRSSSASSIVLIPGASTAKSS
jgi:hypothetical protein